MRVNPHGAVTAQGMYSAEESEEQATKGIQPEAAIFIMNSVVAELLHLATV